MGVEAGEFGLRITTMGEKKQVNEQSENIHFLVQRVREQQAEIEQLKKALLRILAHEGTPTIVQRMCHEGLEKST